MRTRRAAGTPACSCRHGAPQGGWDRMLCSSLAPGSCCRASYGQLPPCIPRKATNQTQQTAACASIANNTHPSRASHEAAAPRATRANRRFTAAARCCCRTGRTSGGTGRAAVAVASAARVPPARRGRVVPCRARTPACWGLQCQPTPAAPPGAAQHSLMQHRRRCCWHAPCNGSCSDQGTTFVKGQCRRLPTQPPAGDLPPGGAA